MATPRGRGGVLDSPGSQTHMRVGKDLASTRMSKMHPLAVYKGFPGGISGKNPPVNAGEIRDMGLTPGLGRSPGGRYGNPLQDSCWENLMGREAW